MFGRSRSGGLTRLSDIPASFIGAQCRSESAGRERRRGWGTKRVRGRDDREQGSEAGIGQQRQRQKREASFGIEWSHGGGLNINLD